jgi:hypothetical protein
MNGIPMVRLTLEHMQIEIVQAINTYMAQKSEEFQAAIEQACTPEKVARIVAESVERELKEALAKEVRNFFAWGKGRQVLKDAIDERLTRDLNLPGEGEE